MDSEVSSTPIPIMASVVPSRNAKVHVSTIERPVSTTASSLTHRGLNVQWPFGGAIADGFKTAEVREVPLGPSGKATGYNVDGVYWLLQTKGGTKRKAIADTTLEKDQWRPKPRSAAIVALVKFTACTTIKTANEFDDARGDTLIRRGSKRFDWKGSPRFPWHVEIVHSFVTPIDVKTGQSAPWIEVLFSDAEKEDDLPGIPSVDVPIIDENEQRVQLSKPGGSLDVSAASARSDQANIPSAPRPPITCSDVFAMPSASPAASIRTVNTVPVSPTPLMPLTPISVTEATASDAQQRKKPVDGKPRQSVKRRR